MTVKRDTPVDNKKIVEGPATMQDSDNFELCAINMQEIVKIASENEKLNKKNAKIVATNVRRPVLSVDLMQGMTISAKTGGKPEQKRESKGMEH